MRRRYEATFLINIQTFLFFKISDMEMKEIDDFYNPEKSDDENDVKRRLLSLETKYISLKEEYDKLKQTMKTQDRKKVLEETINALKQQNIDHPLKRMANTIEEAPTAKKLRAENTTISSACKEVNPARCSTQTILKKTDTNKTCSFENREAANEFLKSISIVSS